MCDLKAYVKIGGREELFLESVNQLRVEKGMVVMKNLFGEEKSVRGEVAEVSLIKSKVVIETER